MKLLKSTLCAISFLGATSAAIADDCPNYLPINLLQDCIVETGAGSDYNTEQKYKEWREIQTQKLDAHDNYTDASTTTAASN